MRAALPSLILVILLAAPATSIGPTHPRAGAPAPAALPLVAADAAVANFSAALGRLVDLVAAGGASLLALVWTRVALSWFSHDVTKKIQAKERARDALVGSLIFTAALSGLVWGLAEWVLTGR